MFQCFFYIFFILTSCENSKAPTFQTIEYASFDINSYRTKKKDSVYINMFYTISKQGLIEINNQDDYHNRHTYYSFQLTQTEISKLDSIFNQRHKLKSYLANTKMKDNSFYAGSYDYFRVTYSNGTVDSICIIQPFMSEDFESTYKLLDSTIYDREDKIEIKEFDVPDYFKLSLKKSYFKSSYLPEIKTIPAFRPEDQGK